ncbi:MAG TPA: DUF2252 domain-containing protein [Actinomycetes bacterium]|jgi:uncharacterized protein (DUF2252 family)|nr:DUF2252 domain-containing protein [Actinomycetes bacterium]
MSQQEVGRQGAAGAGAQKVVAHPSLEERQTKGRVARAETPHAGLSVWEPAADRADPVALLTGQETSRVQELVPVRHTRMAVSAFTFYRGAALVMAADLAGFPRSGLDVQLCGDAHLSNFGLFAAPDRSVIFDVNDFDETNPGPFEWDVKRLATSFVLAARDNGLSAKAGRAAAEAAAGAYRQSMAAYAGKPEIEIWYDRIDAARLVGAVRDLPSGKGKSEAKKKAKAEATIQGAAAKARLRDAWSAIEKITEVVDGRRRFRDQPPLLTRLDIAPDAAAQLNALFREYRATLQDDRQELLKRYEIIDMGHKVVGVGSVGLLAFVLLLRGRDENDLMVLQVKQAQASVLEGYTRKSVFTKHGHRVVTGQRLMQAASDSFLGWIDGPAGRSFYVRQLRDMKWSPDPASLSEKRIGAYAVLCGHTLGRAHARSGDAIAISAYLGTGKSFDKAVSVFAESYADQTEQDFAAFTGAIADGRLGAHEDAGGAEGIRATQALNAGPAKRKRTAKRTT